jgi:integrase
MRRGKQRLRVRYPTGDGRHVTFIFWPNQRKDAAAKLRELQRQHEEGLPVGARGRHTVGTWLREWLDGVALAHPRSHPNYAAWVKHMAPIADVPLAKLDGAHVRQLLAQKRAEGQLNGTSLGHIHTTLHTAMEGAVQARQVGRNPVKEVPKPEREFFEAPVLSEVEAQRLAAECLSDRLGALVILAIATGAREGELLALTWRDVSFETGKVHFQKSVRYLPGRGMVVGPTKTRAGNRRVGVDRLVLEVLEEHHRRQGEQRLAAGPAWQERDLVFATEIGTHISASNMTKRFYRPLLSRARVTRPVRFHDLRHSAALFMMRLTHLVTVSQRLGHSSTTITGEFYGHAEERDDQALATALGRLLLGGVVDDATSGTTMGTTISPETRGDAGDASEAR